LRFRRSRVTQEQYVDITTDAVLTVDVLRNASEQGECEGCFDVFVSVNRRRNGFDDALPNTFVSCEGTHLLLVFLSKTERCKQIFLFIDVVGLDDCGEDWEPVLRI
jgi:hypothetical protein